MNHFALIINKQFFHLSWYHAGQKLAQFIGQFVRNYVLTSNFIMLTNNCRKLPDKGRKFLARVSPALVVWYKLSF